MEDPEIKKSLRDSEEMISLNEAANRCPYTAEYLSLRARQGKLKAKKIRGVWLTKNEWLQDYIRKSSKISKEKDFKEKLDELIPLNEAANLCSYSAEYLGLRARQEKLKAVKIKNIWFTTRRWLETYLEINQEVLLVKKQEIFKKELPAAIISKDTKEILAAESTLNNKRKAKNKFYVSDNPEWFNGLAKRFLGQMVSGASKVNNDV